MPKIPKIERVRVLAIESPSILDCFDGRTESQTLQSLCKLLGHDFSSTPARSEAELRTALRHATSINPDHLPDDDKHRPLCLHIAAHGNSSGIALGADSMEWDDLGECLWTFSQEMKHYPGPIILIISACGASNQKLTALFQKNARDKSKSRPPAYVITAVGNDEGEVYWADSVVAWSIFYHQIGKAVLEKHDIQVILGKIQLVGAGKLKYFRWDSKDKKYYGYESKCKEHSKESSKPANKPAAKPTRRRSKR